MTRREAFGGQGGFWAGNARIGEASHRGHGGHRGGRRGERERLWVTTRWLLGGKRANWGRHRTEVTEVTEGGWLMPTEFYW